MDYFLLLISLVLVLLGANYLVDGASNIAKRLGLSEFLIGLTIVAIGTSAPEMVVSCISAFKGNSEMAVGNVLGSNIFNTLMIIGIVALVTPIPLTSNNIKKDIPFGFLAAFILCVLGAGAYLNNSEQAIVNRTDGLILLAFYGVFLAYTIYSSTRDNSAPMEDIKEINAPKTKKGRILLDIIMIIGGLTALIYGGDLFVEKASIIARSFGVSEAVIAVTIMAVGTSLPELASSLMAAIKKNTDMALGNVIGSNITNIFLVLGLSATINPLPIVGIKSINFIALFISALLMFISAFTFKKKEVDRTEGIIFIILYIAFVIVLLQ